MKKLFFFIFLFGGMLKAEDFKTNYYTSGGIVLASAYLLLGAEQYNRQKGYYIPEKEYLSTGNKAAFWSDVTLLAAVTGSAAALSYQGKGGNLSVMAEAVFINAALNAWTKSIAGKKRPEVSMESKNADAYGSFYSGHTAIAFSAATLGWYYLSGQDKGGWGLSLEALALATGVLRITAGKHDAYDIITGCMVGVATSLIITKQHTENKTINVGFEF